MIMEKCAELAGHILSLLDNSVISEDMAESLAAADEEEIDLQYAETLVRWIRAGCNPLESFVTNNSLFLHFRQSIQERFGLEILTSEEATRRAEELRHQIWLPHFVGYC